MNDGQPPRGGLASFSTSPAIAWIALALAIAALILHSGAPERQRDATGNDLVPDINESFVSDGARIDRMAKDITSLEIQVQTAQQTAEQARTLALEASKKAGDATDAAADASDRADEARRKADEPCLIYGRC